MTRTTLIATVALLTGAGIGLVALGYTRAADVEPIPAADIDRTPIGESYPAEITGSQPAPLRVVGSDRTARFVSLGLNKSLIIELKREASNVLVTNPTIANAIFEGSNRRFYIVGISVGQTNIFFLDANGRQVAALDVNVARGLPPAPSELSGESTREVIIYRGPKQTHFTQLNCSLKACVVTHEADTGASTEEAPPTNGANNKQ